MDHSDKAITDFLQNKSTTSILLFEKLVATFNEIGAVEFYAAKTIK